MTPWVKSLVYDAVFLTLCAAVFLLSSGEVRQIARLLFLITLVKAPYDVWEARRSTGPDRAR